MGWLHGGGLRIMRNRFCSMRSLGVAATLAIMGTAFWRPDAAMATIVLGSTTVTSITHGFGVHHSPDFSEIADYLANFSGQPTPTFSANLDSDTSISYSLFAPAGQKFVVHVPAGESPYFYSYLAWQTGF